MICDLYCLKDKSTQICKKKEDNTDPVIPTHVKYAKFHCIMQANDCIIT